MQFTSVTKLVARVAGNITDYTFTLFRPCTYGGQGYFYDIFALDDEEVANMSFPVIGLNSYLAVAPISFTPVYDYNEFRATRKFVFYRPVAPAGFCALGLVAAESVDKLPNNILCLHASLVTMNAEASTIKVFNPFGVYVDLFRTSALYCDIGESPPLIADAALAPSDFTVHLAEIADGIYLTSASNMVLPVIDFCGGKDFYLSLLPDDDENDNMRDLQISQIEAGCGVYLSNFPVLKMQESEYFYPAQSFELVGVTSKTKPTQSDMQEDYLYVFRPIAPPGYVALSLVVSQFEYFDQVVFCVAEYLTMQTNQCTALGRIYSASTASYILNYVTLRNSGEANAEVTRKQRKLGLPLIEEVYLVVPRGSLGCIYLADEGQHSIITPTLLSFVNCQVSVSYKSLMRGIKQAKEVSFVNEFSLPNNRTLRVFQSKLEKPHYSTLIYSFIVKDGHTFDFSVFSKPDTKAESKSEQKTEMKAVYDTYRSYWLEQVQVPAYLPLELSMIAHSAYFDLQTLAEPQSYVIVADYGLGAARVRLVKLVPPPGFCALSDAIWIGDKPFDKARFACINSSFCYSIKAKPICSVSDRYQLVESVLPYGTLELQQSEFRALHFLEKHQEFDTFNIWILKDNVFYAHAYQEQMYARVKYQGKNVVLDKQSLEVQLLLKSVLELPVKDYQVFGKIQVLNVTEPYFLTFGTSVDSSYLDDYYTQAGVQKESTYVGHDIYQNYAEMTAESAADSAKRVLVATHFGSEISPNGLFAKPREVKRIGQFEDGGRTLYVHKLIAYDNFIALGDVITDQELLYAEAFVTVHLACVTYCTVNEPQFILSGYYDTNGVWVYQSGDRIFAYDFPEEHIKVPKLKPAFETAASSQTKYAAIYPHNDGICVVDPVHYYNLFASFSHNNRISINALKVYDFNMNQFDANAVNDPLCKTAAFVSLSNMRLYNTNQRLTAELIQPALKQEQLALQPLANDYIAAKAKLLASLYDILEALYLTAGFNYFGKKAHLAFPISDCGFVAISDKLPFSPHGAYFLGEGCLVKHCIFEKFCAKCVGSYNKMYDMDAPDLVKIVLDLFGMNTRAIGSWVFDIYLCSEAVSVEQCAGSIPIRVWKE